MARKVLPRQNPPLLLTGVPIGLGEKRVGRERKKVEVGGGTAPMPKTGMAL